MKRILAILLVAVVSFAIIGCSTKGPSEEVQNDDIQQEASNDVEKVEPVKENEIKISEINKGEVIVIEDYCEFEIQETKFAKKVSPPNPGTFFTYYEVKEADTIFLDTVVKIKSLLETGKSSDEFANVKVYYNNKYEYNTFATIEESGGSNFTYTNITSIEPLKNGTLHFLAEVPSEVESSTNPVHLIITVNGKDYKYIVK